MWWQSGRREDWSWIQIPSSQRVSTPYLFGEIWPNVPFLQFMIVTEEEARQARRQTPGVAHVGGMDENFDRQEGYLMPRWNGVKRAISQGSEASDNPAPHVSQRLTDDHGGMKRSFTPGSDESGNPRPHVSQRLSDGEDDQTPYQEEELSEDDFFECVEEEDFWNGLCQRDRPPDVQVPGQCFPVLPCQAANDHEDHLELAMDAYAAFNCCDEDVLNGHVLVHRYDSMGCYTETVIEREMNILAPDELKKYARDVAEACLLELQRWCGMGMFTRMSRKRATNLVDSRWVLKWKLIGGVRKIKARLTVGGFKDRQAESLTTFAGTASRWGQRSVCSMATTYQWKLW